jgi:cell division septum initiation protein DivIVA
MDSRHAPATFLPVPGAAADQRSDVEELRARVAELERELAERTERANAAVAAAEDRLYWVERWKIDLDELMQRRAGRWAFRLTENARRARRLAGRIRRRLPR